jgi:Zn-finger nucleic acid-binding protein
MRAYERNGVTVDQCGGCRGIFLDRGELERLIDAETGFYARSGEPDRDQHPYRGDRKRKRTSFLSELFD